MIKFTSFIFALILLIGACDKQVNTQINSNGSMFRADLQRSGVYQTKALNELSGIKWKFKYKGDSYSSPTVYKGTVYFGTGSF
jgi:hypothetical protein